MDVVKIVSRLGRKKILRVSGQIYAYNFLISTRARTNVSFPPRSSWHAPHVYMIKHTRGGGVYCSPRMVIRPVFGTVTGDLLIFELCLVFTNLSPIVNACSTTINTCFFPSSFSPSISIHDSSDLETHALGYPITSGDSHEARATYDESHEFQRLHIFSSYLA